MHMHLHSRHLHGLHAQNTQHQTHGHVLSCALHNTHSAGVASHVLQIASGHDQEATDNFFKCEHCHLQLTEESFGTNVKRAIGGEFFQPFVLIESILWSEL